MARKYTFLYRRMFLVLPTVWLAVSLVWVLFNVIPGDAALIMLGTESTPETLAALRTQLGLDIPLHERYFSWLSQLFVGDLGKSIRTREKVSILISQKLPATATLGLFSMFVALLIGVPTGILSATRRNSAIDTLSSTVAYLGVSTPGFFLGILFILAFSVRLRILPSGGFVSVFEDPVQGLRFIILPSIALGVGLAAIISRMVRSSLLEVLLQDYIVTARAKGLANRVVIYKHALKNALIPVVTIIGIQVGTLLGGSVIIEQIFSVGGIGRLMYGGILERDFPLVQGVALLIVLIYIITNLVVDMVYMYLDPRVRFD